MSEYLELQPTEEIDATLAEMESFNDLVEQIDAIPVDVKETLQEETSTGKFGQLSDLSNGFGQER